VGRSALTMYEVPPDRRTGALADCDGLEVHGWAILDGPAPDDRADGNVETVEHEDEADGWGVYRHRVGLGGVEWIEDFATRPEAEAFALRLLSDCPACGVPLAVLYEQGPGDDSDAAEGRTGEKCRACGWVTYPEVQP